MAVQSDEQVAAPSEHKEAELAALVLGAIASFRGVLSVRESLSSVRGRVWRFFVRPIDIVDMQKAQNHRCLDVVRDFKQRMYDIHFEIMDMVEAEVKVLKVIEEERLRLIVLEAERR